MATGAKGWDFVHNQASDARWSLWAVGLSKASASGMPLPTKLLFGDPSPRMKHGVVRKARFDPLPAIGKCSLSVTGFGNRSTASSLM